VILTITSFLKCFLYYSSLPLNLKLGGISCQIDDNSGRGCNAYLRSITKQSQCVVDIKFGYAIINEGPACVEIKDVKATLGPYPMSMLAFDDVIRCGNRMLCQNNTWNIPQRKRSVNICTGSQSPNPWLIDVKVTDTKSRSKSLTDQFIWAIINQPIPTTPQPAPPSGPSGPSGPSKGKKGKRRMIRRLK